MSVPTQSELDQFRKTIGQWSTEHPRPMPWKNFSDPYSIWIAEIILQQTRVDQGTPYFEKFIRHFPNLSSLALSSVEDVLVAWEGLGYYRRARHLHQTARYIYTELKGEFPNNYSDLLKLKGVGPYTAAAIASFAFDERVGVVDGNVKRVVSRYFNIQGSVNTARIHKDIQALVDRVVRTHSSAEFNQAVMNFGALQCIPREPDCLGCPANSHCKAYLMDKVDLLPVKKSAPSKQQRWLYFGIYICEGRIALMRNIKSKIWNGLYMFPMIGDIQEFELSLKSTRPGKEPDLPLLDDVEWVLSHRRLKIKYYRLENPPDFWRENEDIFMVESENLVNFAIPRPLRLFLRDNSCKLNLNEYHDQ